MKGQGKNISFLCGILLLLLLIQSVSIPRLERSGYRPVWSGYLTVLVDSASLGTVCRVLEESGASFIAESNTFIDFYDYNQWQRLSVGELRARFEPGDQRVDPYMEALRTWFDGSVNGEARDIIYIKTKDSVSAARQLRDDLQESGAVVSFPDYAPPLGPRGLLYWGVVLLLFLFLAPRRRGMVLLQGLLWAPLLWSGAGLLFTRGILFASFFLYFLFDAEKIWLKKLRGGEVERAAWQLLLLKGVAVLAVAAGALTRLPGGQERLLFVAGIVSSVMGALLLGAVFRIRSCRHEHPLFNPVFIKGPVRSRIKGIAFIRFALLLALLTGAPFWAALGLESGSLRFPSPVSTVHPDLSEGEPWPAPPDREAFWAHRAYQLGFMYGREYRPPRKNETLTLQRYRIVQGAPVAYSETIFTFTPEWFRESLEAAPPGPMTLLHSSGVAGAVLGGKMDKNYRKGADTLYIALYCLLLSVLLYSRYRTISIQFPIVKLRWNLTKKRQTA